MQHQDTVKHVESIVIAAGMSSVIGFFAEFNPLFVGLSALAALALSGIKLYRWAMVQWTIIKHRRSAKDE